MTSLTRTKKGKNGLKLPKPLSAPQELPTAPPIPIESVDPKDPLAIAIYYHEINELTIAAYYFSVSAARGNPMGLIMYAIALRHGWGIKKNEVEAVKWLQSAADKALVDLDIVTCDYSKKSIRTNIQNKEQTKTVITDELIMAIFELAICFKQGWGVKKSAQTAAYYLNIAAQLGDSEAQTEMGELYLRGEGVKQDKKLAAKWFRQAEKNGARMVSMQWIWKPKYD